ncbi:uncharacterized protein FRV6_16961 [Fusarium oxysporum]|uniref:Uncharacterized protein n=1 Tax=Fusarium oxysporum TaxID=5507 RepID=A0A2H3TW46_FUSOX|nr:uncharacterized protein FRV6_16961 [Fusarium oxysporum]
MPSLTSFKN